MKTIKNIKTHIRSNMTPCYVPAVICEVSKTTKTKSGKEVEIAVRDVVHGRVIKNSEAIANPHVLEEFKNRPELVLKCAIFGESKNVKKPLIRAVFCD